MIDIEKVLSIHFGPVGRKIELGSLIEGREVLRQTPLGTELIMPLDMAMPGVTLQSAEGVEVKTIDGQSYWQLQLEPMISIKGSNKLIIRNTAATKKNGEHIESWSQGNFRISIRGILQNLTGGAFPMIQLKQLREFLVFDNSILVRNAYLNAMGIQRIAIKDYDLPFTEGETLQEYTISAVADSLFDDLLEEI